MRALGASRVLVAHDGFRAARFADSPSRAQARAALGIPAAAFVVGYVGRMHTMEMPKGLDTLVEAVACAVETGAEIDLLLVGGPEASAAALRAQWIARGLLPERLHAAGQVAPDAVPRHLAAMDVGVMPLPWTDHFAYYASALKLFEYMAAGCAVVASNLPSTAEVLRDEVSGLLVPPGDATALAHALQRLHTDRHLGRRLGEQARSDVQQYTWSARAARIRASVEGMP
jgi:glycosyltransferase involved in cell wall biosynthesis